MGEFLNFLIFIAAIGVAAVVLAALANLDERLAERWATRPLRVIVTETLGNLTPLRAVTVVGVAEAILLLPDHFFFGWSGIFKAAVFLIIFFGLVAYLFLARTSVQKITAVLVLVVILALYDYFSGRPFEGAASWITFGGMFWFPYFVLNRYCRFDDDPWPPRNAPILMLLGVAAMAVALVGYLVGGEVTTNYAKLLGLEGGLTWGLGVILGIGGFIMRMVESFRSKSSPPLEDNRAQRDTPIEFATEPASPQASNPDRQHHRDTKAEIEAHLKKHGR
jgi:hypothetical protein